jgi:endonuclease/exonuclease/phosphatase family metal-dependent hydrolase
VAIVSLNRRGVPPIGSNLAGRYAVVATALDVGDGDVVCFQEVLSWWHLRLLVRRMRSFRHVSFRSSVAGPAGGLVTFSRLPVSDSAYRGFGVPPATAGISRATRLLAGTKGVLITRLTRPGLCVINTHPVANRDGDWSPAGRFYPLHDAQLAVVARVVRGVAGPAVVCGDFNVDRQSSLFDAFVADAGLADAFQGSCPPTFRAEYLPAGAAPRCIDFILTAGEINAEAAALVFAGKEPMPGGPGYVSDHIGLRASLVIKT